ncbi:endonuclease/exonuclease/phosphatase family protein [Tessaracoccus caeni]|uniref:endonuclease/exonuclease/phosphatase family protein n=1 Tax=Tessaracoccus caeni TaxID=3031239 RepID=UPI0023DA5E01|nr:endonuclease/exonuclease/phosphatase family protein [Tessaracoccus caeni]MDF1489534.1 endonuclease/exonuclease/phosphatase family protein [Tessaracoccus caeni]
MTSLRWLPRIGLAGLLMLAAIYLVGYFTGVANRTWIFGGALAFPVVSFILAATAALLLLVLSVSIRTWRTRANIVSTASAAVTFGLTAVLLIATTPSPAQIADLPDRGDGFDVRALAWNVKGKVPADAMADLMTRTDADVAAFAELRSGGSASSFARGRHPEGYQLFHGIYTSVTLLVADRLGEYRLAAADEDGAWTGVVAEPLDPTSDSPRIVAVHATRMALDPTIGAQGWRRALTWITRQCAETNTIALGDFNAGPANFTDGRLGECQLHSLGTSAPTWPSTVPVPLGATIDHVLATPDWTPTYARTLDVPASGTDHRPVFSVLTR